MKSAEDILREVAAEYRTNGYDVRFTFGADDVPRGLAADMIAVGAHERVVVAIKELGPQDEGKVRQLLDWIKANPGWRLELLVPPARSSFSLPPAKFEAIDRRIRTADQLALEGNLADAVVLLWAAAEALLQQIVSRDRNHLVR